MAGKKGMKGPGLGGARPGSGQKPGGRPPVAPGSVTGQIGGLTITKPISPTNGPVITILDDPREFLRNVQQGFIDPTTAQLKAALGLLASLDRAEAAKASAEKSKGVKAQRTEAAKDALDAGASKFAPRPRLVA